MGIPALEAKKRVAVKADAIPGYEESRVDEKGEKLPASYVFLKGEFFEGAIRDRSLERTEITQVAHALAPYLAKQNYLPTKSTGDADIVIAVHYGLTTSLRHNTEYVANMMERARDRQLEAQETYNALYTDGDGNETVPTDFAQALLQESRRQEAEAPDYDWARMASARSERDISEQPTATVLGFDEQLNLDSRRAFSSEEERTLRAYLNEERYFVVLMAYDLKNREDGRPLQRLWVARLSMPSNGTNFTEALDELGKVGAEYFGTDQPGLKVHRPPEQDVQVEVEIGDTIVIEEDAK